MTHKPFIYLSAGVSNPVFIETLELAGESGTKFNGVLCGRATWKEGIPVYAKQGAGLPRLARNHWRREHPERQRSLESRDPLVHQVRRQQPRRTRLVRVSPTSTCFRHPERSEGTPVFCFQLSECLYTPSAHPASRPTCATLSTSTPSLPNPEPPLTIIRILVGLIQAILKVFADAFLRGGALLVSALVVLALIVAAVWFVTLFAISLFRRSRSQ